MRQDARRRWVEIELFGSEVLEPGFGKQGDELGGGRRRSGRGGTGATRLGDLAYGGDAGGQRGLHVVYTPRAPRRAGGSLTPERQSKVDTPDKGQ